MRAGGAKEKGSKFERAVAAEIIKAAGKPFKKKDCYRTPLSGGHIYSRKNNPADLMISKRLRKIFPFSVECKHYKDIDLQHFFTGQGKMRSWIDQVLRSTKDKRLTPIVIFRWNSSRTFCILPYESYTGYGTHKPHIKFKYKGRNWSVILLPHFLDLVFT